MCFLIRLRDNEAVRYGFMSANGQHALIGIEDLGGNRSCTEACEE